MEFAFDLINEKEGRNENEVRSYIYIYLSIQSIQSIQCVELTTIYMIGENWYDGNGVHPSLSIVNIQLGYRHMRYHQ